MIVRCANLSMICDPHQEYIWRVYITERGDTICEHVGYLPIDICTTSRYSSLDKTPEWMQDRVAVLRMMPPDPNDSIIYNVGRRVNECTFWVVQPVETVGVDDPGGESQESSGDSA